MEESNIALLTRLCDVADEHLRIMAAIEGYQHVRLMSLTEAVKPLVHLFPEKTLERSVWIVLERCKTPRDGLSTDESASIMLYTYQGWTFADSFYFVLNKTLRLEDRSLLRPWFPYLRLFIGALIKLPPIQTLVHRGLKGVDNSIVSAYRDGAKIYWWGFSSCTTNLGVLQSRQFCGDIGSRTMFHISCLEGRDIKNHTFYQTEEEILLLPGRYLKVKGVFKNGDGLWIISLDEIRPPHELIDLPDNSCWLRFVPGINFFGTCDNSACLAYGKKIIIPIGMRRFNLLEDASESSTKCPVCGRYVEISINKIGFSECRRRIKGRIRMKEGEPPTEYLNDWSNTSGYTLNEHKVPEGNWLQFIIDVERLPST